MLAFQQTLLVVNLLLTLVFGMDCLVVASPKSKPRTKARIGVLLGVLFFVFMALLALFIVLGVALKRNALYIALAVYEVIPFAIGRFASYRTLRLCASLQLLALLASAVTLHVMRIP